MACADLTTGSSREASMRRLTEAIGKAVIFDERLVTLFSLETATRAVRDELAARPERAEVPLQVLRDLVADLVGPDSR